jgi:hypothetical protein
LWPDAVGPDADPARAGAPEFGRGQTGIGLEGAIERPDRLESGVHGDGQHRHIALAQVGQRRLGFVDPAKAETLRPLSDSGHRRAAVR